MGRFLSEDAVASANRYPYANGDPISFTDRLGLMALVEYSAQENDNAESTPAVDGLGNAACRTLSLLDAFQALIDFVGPGAELVRSGSGGWQAISRTTFDNGDVFTRIGRLDINPGSAHVRAAGPHLNLEAQFNGRTLKNGFLRDPHIPIDPSTIRETDWKC